MTIPPSRMIPAQACGCRLRILVVLVVVIGVAPFLAEPFVKLVTASVLGDAAEVPKALFQDLARAGASALHVDHRVVGGLLMLAVFNPPLRLWDATPRPEAKVIFEAIVEAVVAAGPGADPAAAQRRIHALCGDRRRHDHRGGLSRLDHRHSRRRHARDAARERRCRSPAG